MAEDEFMLTPAVFRALVENDLQNARRAATPGGIEAQEQEGQESLLDGKLLPTEHLLDEGKAVLERAGVLFGKPRDKLFTEVILPPGWHIAVQERPYYTQLIDAHGRARARIFYKAAFYDRRARITVLTRYSFRIESAGDSDPVYGCVTDGGCPIWRTGPFHDSSEFLRYFADPTYAMSLMDAERSRIITQGSAHRQAEDACKVYLDETYPNWRVVSAYWDT